MIPFSIVLFIVLGWHNVAIGNLFRDVPYNSIGSTLEKLRGDYAFVTTAHESFDHPIVKDNALSCSPHIVQVTDINSLRDDQTRPQVLISGEIHGDERVGPGVTIPLAQLLVWSVECMVEKKISSCEQLDLMGGISKGQRTWLAFLATRRETLIIPTANCMGYMKNIRSDGHIDPNRDYPYSRKDERCFLSSSARLFKVIMETSIIQTVVTFHGGMVALGYEWGSKNHMAPKDRSPDENAHKSVALQMKEYAGGFKQEKPYPVGRINSLIYPVDGGMEDWLYAAGWDPGNMQQHCVGDTSTTTTSTTEQRPLGWKYTTRKLYPIENLLVSYKSRSLRSNSIGVMNKRETNQVQDTYKEKFTNPRILTERTTVVTKAENRAVVFLVETSNWKKPLDSSLGGTDKILDPSASQNGHIPRNVRLSLTAIDMVQPYVCFSQAGLVTTTTTTVPAATAVETSSAPPRSLLSMHHTTSTTPSTTTITGVKPGRREHVRHFAHHPHRIMQANSTDNTETNAVTQSKRTSLAIGTLTMENTTNNDNISETPKETLSENTLSLERATQLAVEWYVGGATTVDCTFLAWHPYPANGISETSNSTVNWSAYLASLDHSGLGFMDRFQQHCGSNKENKVTSNKKNEFPVIASSPQYGRSRWSSSDTINTNTDTITSDSNTASTTLLYEQNDPIKPKTKYMTQVSPSFPRPIRNSHTNTDTTGSTDQSFPPGRYLLVSWAMTDQNFGDSRQGFPMDSAPQSHLSNIRTNPAYRKQVHDRIVQGRMFWPSDPIIVRVHENYSVSIESSVLDCTWWDRSGTTTISTTTGTGTTTTGTTQYHKIEHTGYGYGSYRENPELSGYNTNDSLRYNANRLYSITFGLLLITGLCCACLYYHWRRNSIYTQVSSNKYVNYTNFRHFRTSNAIINSSNNNSNSSSNLASIRQIV